MDLTHATKALDQHLRDCQKYRERASDNYERITDQLTAIKIQMAYYAGGIAVAVIIANWVMGKLN